jgi:hypothetical protein
MLAFLTALAPIVTETNADPAITTGSPDGARKYYADISENLKELKPTPSVTTLDDVLKFAGYPASADKIESLDPAILMSPERATAPEGLGISPDALAGVPIQDGDILASRFFAPKIVNVNTKAAIPGWRNLIRLRVRSNSHAAKAGVDNVIILFNFLVPANAQPFTGKSFNTQVMLLAPTQAARLYWLDFDGDKKLTLALNASFDAADFKSPGNHDYFVPDGCNNCHGNPANFDHPMVNYLDTDHWFDRLNDDDGFADLKAAGTAIIFDAGTNDSSQPSFARAFDIIRRLNVEALQQNNLIRTNSFEAQAARTWLKLHATSNNHFPPVARGFSLISGPNWQQSEADGLAKLNRYCFRCHGSVRFSVFDRPTVLTNAGALKQHIKPNEDQAGLPGFKMPPDRILPPKEIDALCDFLENLK